MKHKFSGIPAAAGLFLLSSLTPATAQLSVSTFGATDAQSCFEDASDNLTASTAHCDKALKNEGLTRKDQISTRVNRGIILNRAGRLDEAMADFDAVLDAQPMQPEALLNRGNTYFLMKRYDSAIADYEAALAYGIRKAQVAWFNIGLAYEAKKQPKDARAAFIKALEISPDFVLAQTKLESLPE